MKQNLKYTKTTPLVFSEYMHQWLYSANGYYTNHYKIGKDGDFYTSVSSSRYFGGAMAQYIYAKIASNKLPKNISICEIGAHKGYLISDIVQFLYTLDPDIIKNIDFCIVEPYEQNEKMQRQYMKESFGNAVSFRWIKNARHLKTKHAIFIANEVFDAQKCELYNNGKQAFIYDGKLIWETSQARVKKLAKTYDIKKGEIGYFDEIIKDVSLSSKHTEFIIFDYGQWEARNDFSLRIYKNHTTKSFNEIDFINDFSKCDLTYDVCFSQLAKIAQDFGFSHTYKTQLKALLDFGITNILELAAQHYSHTDLIKEMSTVKTLLDPALLGERFKCLHLKR